MVGKYHQSLMANMFSGLRVFFSWLSSPKESLIPETLKLDACGISRKQSHNAFDYGRIALWVSRNLSSLFVYVMFRGIHILCNTFNEIVWFQSWVSHRP